MKRFAFLSYLVAGCISLEGVNSDIEDAYVYGYPLVLMDTTKDSFTGGQRSRFNEFVHLREFPNPSFHDVVSPNADTLYSSAWLDLTNEPVILSVPEIQNRYYLLELLDEWTNVIASVGTRTNGGKKGSYAIVGPKWTGSLPQDAHIVRSPTNFVWIIGRTETRGPQDYAAVHKIQDQYSIRPLNSTAAAKPGNYLPSKGVAPVDQVAKMSGADFFTKFSELINSDAPPLPQDEAIVRKMASFGLIPGQSFNAKPQLDADAKQALEKIVAGWKGEKFAKNENGWLISTGNVGNYGTDYFFRAIVAYGGLGANLVEDAIYPVTRVDSAGKPLSGKNRYVVHFDQAPPVTAFWSITMYDDRQFFVENPINRYKIGSNDNLKVNPDGSIDIYIQNQPPGPDKESNWLPAPQGDFNLMMRLYGPKREILDGLWKPPFVKQV